MRHLVLLGRLAFPCCALPARFLGVCCASNSTWLSRLCHKILLVFIGNIETYAEDIKRAPSALARLCWRMTPASAERSCCILRLQTMMQCQAHKVGSTGLGTRRLGQDGINAHQIDRHSGEHVLQLYFVQAIRA